MHSGGEWRGRWAVVTGGAGALGTAVVGRLLDLGASCAVPCRSGEELDGFIHRDHDRVRCAADVDLADEGAVAAFYADATRWAGDAGLWASIHIAGGFAMSPLAETSRADFQRQIDMNATTCFLCCREAARAMGARAPGGKRGSGGKGGGRIVNIAARPALEPRTGGGMVAYTASKAAVAAITAAAAEELVSEGILVNAVVPSIMDTPANRAAMPGADHAKWPGVDEVAATVVFLASPGNACTRGGLVPVYGRS